MMMKLVLLLKIRGAWDPSGGAYQPECSPCQLHEDSVRSTQWPKQHHTHHHTKRHRGCSSRRTAIVGNLIETEVAVAVDTSERITAVLGFGVDRGHQKQHSASQESARGVPSWATCRAGRACSARAAPAWAATRDRLAHVRGLQTEAGDGAYATRSRRWAQQLPALR